MYYRGVQNPKIGYYDGATEKLMAGAAFPDKAAMGDVYLCGDYEYRLNEFDGFLWWTVNIKDKTKETYSPLLNDLAGVTIGNLDYAFKGCVNMITAPEIPKSVTHMEGTFQGCTSLVEAPAIPYGVITLGSTFYGCTKLSVVPEIPATVTQFCATFENCTSLKTPPIIHSSPDTPNIAMDNTFKGCSALISAPTIPQNVVSMSRTFEGCVSLKSAPTIPSQVGLLLYTFKGCTSLTGEIEINANPNQGGPGCFSGTVEPIKIVGSCWESTKKELAGTANKGNVTY